MTTSLESIPRQPPEEALLRVRDVVVSFGGIGALNQVTFDVAKHKIVGPIDPNGARKQTLFNCLSRRYEPISCGVELDDTSILDLPAHAMVRLHGQKWEIFGSVIDSNE
ncbi:ATP-binding cassette domain-containing protein [Paraburkholderia sediminicola]|uniref:hypothetical protein n=1 Tax=Paraburkholderia sediminicola TaxID=458836 RepID=UPI000EAC20B2